MNKCRLILLLLVIAFNNSRAQYISGIVNQYSAVYSINGTQVFVAAGTKFKAGDRVLVVQMKGASIDTNNVATFGNVTSMNGAGQFEFADVNTVVGDQVNLSSALTQSYDVSDGAVQMVNVPKLCTPTVITQISCAAWDSIKKEGGIFAIECGTLSLYSNIDVTGKGFKGGNFATSFFCCDKGKYGGTYNNGGGHKGESISMFINNYDGMKGKQANGGGGSNCGNSGGGGGGNGGVGGFGGNQYSGCSTMDERGVGGILLNAGYSKMYLGGGGGGGYRDNNNAVTAGGNGGGIIFIRANEIHSYGGMIVANGSSVTGIADAEGSGGGGAGGSIFISCPSIVGPMSVTANGGSGGSNLNSIFPVECHGTGGGGAGGVIIYSGTSLPSGVSLAVTGGTAGLVLNTQSNCYNTSNGATNGAAGFTMAGLPYQSMTFASPSLTITGNPTICKGETLTLTASGAQTYSWNTGSTTASISIAPTANISYSVAGSVAGSYTCSQTTAVAVSVLDCTGLESQSNAELKIYPVPAADHIIIETGSAGQYEVLDVTGKQLFSGTISAGKNLLQLGWLQPGIYLVYMKNSEKAMVTRISIVR